MKANDGIDANLYRLFNEAVQVDSCSHLDEMETLSSACVRCGRNFETPLKRLLVPFDRLTRGAPNESMSGMHVVALDIEIPLTIHQSFASFEQEVFKSDWSSILPPLPP